MKILILTQYYLPETGAPQNRLSSLAFHLKKMGNEVEILTAMPNYPKYTIYGAYKGKWYCKEEIDGITVHRSSIWVSQKKGLLPRLLYYFSFTGSSLFSARFRLSRPDVLLCESPPLFLGISAVWLKKRWKSKLVFNVSDLWPESVEKLGFISNKWVLGRSYQLAHWIYDHADLISGQTKGIIETISQIRPAKKCFWFPNGIDMERFPVNNTGAADTKTGFTLLYAGIIGHAQGLEVILQAAALLRDRKDIVFYLIGDGPVKQDLIKLRQQLSLENVQFVDNQPSAKIAEWLHRCDAYIVPLKKLDLFKGAIPSKLFEPLAIGKPILLGVDGEAKELFIDDAGGGLHFEPENARELADNILKLYSDPALSSRLGMQGKDYVSKYFVRGDIAARLYEHLKQL